MEKVSVIIPVYGVEKYIEKCLDTIVMQSYSNLEIIIIDDGSQDNSGHICDRYAENDMRIKVIHKRNEGLCAARNEGLKYATGKWTIFIDSDDWCDLDYFEKLENNARNSNADIVLCGGHYIEDKENTVLKRNFCVDQTFKRENMIICMIKILAPIYCMDSKRPASLGAPWDKLYRTDFLKNNQIQFDVTSKAWEDLWFNLNAFAQAKELQVVSSVVGYHYRMVKESITKKYNTDKANINYDFLKKVHAFMDKNNIQSETFDNAIHARSISMFSSVLRNYYFNDKCPLKYKECKREIIQMKEMEFYKEAIEDKNNYCYSKRQRVMRLFLSLPFVFPLKILIKNF